jgi:hypothetical protein
VAQVAEKLPKKYKTLSSNPNTTKKRKVYLLYFTGKYPVFLVPFVEETVLPTLCLLGTLWRIS